MRFYIASDWHADASTNGLDRFDEIHSAAFTVADAAIESQKAGIDSAFIFAGDLCDPDTTRSFHAIGLAIQIALDLAKHRVPSLWIAGNHDVIENDRGSTVLEPLQMVADYVADLITVADIPIRWRCGDRMVFALPYAARSRAYDPIEIMSNARLASIDLIVGHLTVPSAERGSESDDFARGRDMIFPVAECRRRWGDRCILVNGHYHRKQITKDGVHIPGSLARLRHDEEQHEPGYLVIEV
jgi:DNA repair exonuclease SbcCD nuclease subunit